MTDFHDHLLVTFRDEANGYVEAFTAGLLTLERGLEPPARRELLDNLFRQAHSLKGAAQVVGLLPTRDLAHDLESALDTLRRADSDLDPTAFDPLYALVDAIGRSFKDNPAVESTVEPTSASSAEPTAKTETSARVESGLVARSPDMYGGEAVRITTAKLDALFDSAQELLLRTRRMDHWVETLRSLYETVHDWQRIVLAERDARRSDVAKQQLHTLSRLDQLEQQVVGLVTAVEQDTNTLHSVVSNLQTRVMETRMQPAEMLVVVLRRAVRDLIAQTGKQLTFSVQGETIEVDRFVLEVLRDPLIHVLRNAVDHGIESPDVRLRAGKPESGAVTLRLSIIGSYLRVEVSDDGAGMAADDLRSAALRNGLLSVDEANRTPLQQLVALTTHAGFTTRRQVSDLSGRGLGLNIVQRQVESLHGMLDIRTTPGLGTRLVLQVPITLLTLDALIARVDNHTVAIPLTAISRAIRVDAAQFASLNGHPALIVDSEPLPVFSLAALLDLPGQLPLQGPVILLLTGGARPVALQVDSLDGEQPVVVRPFGFPLKRVRNLSGATLLDDGQPAVILNVADILKSAERRVSTLPIAAVSGPSKILRTPRILVVDDSITTRTLEKQILEHMGYEVATAVNGREAFDLARRAVKNKPFDLVISDLMMPIMDGFALTQAIRSDPALETLPVVLVTSMASPEDRQRGLEVGADAYVVKSEFDQDVLLATIRRLIG